MALSDLKKNSARSPKRALSVDEFIAGAEHYAMGLPEPIHRTDEVDDSTTMASGASDVFATRVDVTAPHTQSQSAANTLQHSTQAAAHGPASTTAETASTVSPVVHTASPIANSIKINHKLAPPSAKVLRAVTMKPEPMKHATFTLTAECIALLQELSQLHGTSKSAIVRQLIQLASAEPPQTADLVGESSSVQKANSSTTTLPSSVVKVLPSDSPHGKSAHSNKIE